ncbi:radical SAM protein [Telmatobacter sp. DSM 110680]|uniref:Radical SAM protein n=1 Tax=Telmatobacter sp. DSM 110680 TaxID=3036704 RepID=A0AAU7DE91_9BACT
MKPLFLFVRPPRPLWPFNGPSTAFWPPLAFASMAAALRQHVPEIRVAILDAPALSMGWSTLTQILISLKPDCIGIGEEAVSCVEGLRIARLAKGLGARVVAGGCFFSQVAAQVLATGLVDVVVHGEGEITVVELMRAMLAKDVKALRCVDGISYLDGEEVVFTGSRVLLANLDNLPFPAYDLLPMEKYGAHSRHHPNFTSIEASRGCTHGCEFCVLWRQMGRFDAQRQVPCLRVKSPERLLDEIRILMDRYGRRYLGWVDPCFNADPHTSARLAIGQSAWVRADYVVRDDSSGALKLCCEAGWNEAYLGIERLDHKELARLGKGNLHGEVDCAVQLLRAQYPQVITFGSLIYGLPADTPQSVRALFQAAEKLNIDQLFFIPLTPLPGTPAWKSRMWDTTGNAFRSFDFIPRPGNDELMAELAREIARSYLFDWSSTRFGKVLSDLLDSNARRRGICWNLLWRSLPLMLSTAFKWNTKASGGMVYPAWYES